MRKLPGVNHRRAVRALEKVGFRIVDEGKRIAPPGRRKGRGPMPEPRAAGAGSARVSSSPRCCPPRRTRVEIPRGCVHGHMEGPDPILRGLPTARKERAFLAGCPGPCGHKWSSPCLALIAHEARVGTAGSRERGPSRERGLAGSTSGEGKDVLRRPHGRLPGSRGLRKAGGSGSPRAGSPRSQEVSGPGKAGSECGRRAGNSASAAGVRRVLRRSEAKPRRVCVKNVEMLVGKLSAITGVECDNGAWPGGESSSRSACD